MNPPPPEGPVPVRLRILAVVFILGSLAMGYFFIYQPLAESQQSGTLAYNMKGVVFPPLLLYLGIVMLFSDVRNSQIKQLGPDGKRHYTSKGWAFIVGAVAVLGLTLGAWYLLLSHLGFQAL